MFPTSILLRPVGVGSSLDEFTKSGFRPYVTREALVGCKLLVRGEGIICPPGKSILVIAFLRSSRSWFCGARDGGAAISVIRAQHSEG